MPTPESIVKTKVTKSLRKFRSTGDVIYFMRVNSGGDHCDYGIQGCIESKYGRRIMIGEKGHFDFIISFIGRKSQLCLAFAEIKRQNETPEYRKSQEMFKSMYDGKHIDIHFWLVQSQQEFERILLQHAYNRLAAVEFP